MTNDERKVLEQAIQMAPYGPNLMTNRELRALRSAGVAIPDPDRVPLMDIDAEIVRLKERYGAIQPAYNLTTEEAMMQNAARLNAVGFANMTATREGAD